MKIRRYKKVNRFISFYVNNFGFREPYQMLVDGTFCFAALNVNISEIIPRYLQGELKLLTTQCVLIEMENLGTKLFGALLILKKFTVHKCGHEGKPIPGADCLLSMIKDNNLKHYIIATQDLELQKKIRKIPVIPLLYLHQKAPVLERPSELSIALSEKKVGLTELEKIKINELKKESGLDKQNKKEIHRKKKRKGPNPLSRLKKKKTPATHLGVRKVKEVMKEKKGRKVRIPKHVKEHLFEKVNNK